MSTNAHPAAGTIQNVNGQPCPAAQAADYPLYGLCRHCGTTVKCADGTATWCHVSNYRAQCTVETAPAAVEPERYPFCPPNWDGVTGWSPCRPEFGTRA